MSYDLMESGPRGLHGGLYAFVSVNNSFTRGLYDRSFALSIHPFPLFRLFLCFHVKVRFEVVSSLLLKTNLCRPTRGQMEKRETFYYNFPYLGVPTPPVLSFVIFLQPSIYHLPCYGQDQYYLIDLSTNGKVFLTFFTFLHNLLTETTS